MNDEIKEILDGFDKCLKNYELDKAFGQLSVESIYHLFPHKQLLLKDYITNLQQAFENSYTEEQLDFAVNEVKEQLKIEKQYSNQLCNKIDELRVKNYELQQINNNQAKRNSRQRLANKKQQELILKLQQEIEKLNEDKRGMLVQLYKENVTKDIIQEEYEKIIFEYLAENCSEFDDEHMQHLADLKVEQYIKLQQENEKLILNYKSQKDINQKLLSMDIKHNRELKNYKSKVDNALKIIEKEKELMGYAKYDSCLLLIENTLKNVSEKNDTNNIDNVYKAFGLKG